MKNTRSHVSFVFAMIVLTLSLADALPADSIRPSMVLFIADELSTRDIGCYGGQADTPDIDQLAAEGMRFNACYRTSSVGAPSRQSIFTGLFPMRSGAYTHDAFAKPGTESMPHYLSALGYRVGFIGKRHPNPASAYPFEFLNEETPWLDAEVISAFVLDCGDKPFVLVVASDQPSYPWDLGDSGAYAETTLELPGNWVDTQETRRCYAHYLAEASWMDGQVGAVVQQLKNLGRFDSTAFFYTSAQGSSFPYAKWTCYEAGLHAAMVVRWPGVIEAETVSADIINSMDLLPTMMELAGGTLPADLDGESFKGLLEGRGGGKNHTFAQQTTRGQAWASAYYGIRSVRDSRYTYLVNLTPEILFDCRLTRFGDGFFNSWREAAWQDKRAATLLQGFISRPHAELYDRSRDPFEMNNLAGKPEHRRIQELLALELGVWMDQCGDKGQETEMEALEHSWDHFRRVVEGKFE